MPSKVIDFTLEHERKKLIEAVEDFEAMGPKMGEQVAETLAVLMAMMEGEADTSKARPYWNLFLYTALNFADYCQERFEEQVGEPDIMPALWELKKHLREEFGGAGHAD